MSEERSDTPAGQTQLRDSYVRSGRLPLGRALGLGLRDLFVQPLWLPVKHLPGVVGMQLRQWIYRLLLGRMGRRSLVQIGVEIAGARNVRIGQFTLIDRYCLLVASEGWIEIGQRCHLAPHVLVLGHGGVTIGDYVGIGAGAKIYSISEWPGGGKRLCGPMVPAEHRGLRRAPVRLEQDSFLGAGAVVLPGVTVGQGAVVGANSVVARDVPPWTIVMGVPAMPIGRRDQVNV